VQLIEYTPYGTSSRQEGEDVVTHKFTGKELDYSTSLYWYGSRYYDPQIARFTQADTIVPIPGDPQSLNRYSYCRNNPLIYTDPTGHSFLSFMGSVWGAFTYMWNQAFTQVTQTMTGVGEAFKNVAKNLEECAKRLLSKPKKEGAPSTKAHYEEENYKQKRRSPATDRSSRRMRLGKGLKTGIGLAKTFGVSGGTPAKKIAGVFAKSGTSSALSQAATSARDFVRPNFEASLSKSTEWIAETWGPTDFNITVGQGVVGSFGAIVDPDANLQLYAGWGGGLSATLASGAITWLPTGSTDHLVSRSLQGGVLIGVKLELETIKTGMGYGLTLPSVSLTKTNVYKTIEFDHRRY